MSMSRRGLILTIGAVLALALPAHAQQPDNNATAPTIACPPTANPNIECRTYQVPPIKRSASSEPRVTYFFSYSCKPCETVGAFLEGWSARNKVFVFRVHVAWDNKAVKDAAHAYYAFKRLGVTETLGPLLSSAIHAKQYKFGGADELAAFAQANGVRGDLMKRAYLSPRTREQIRMSQVAAGKFKLDRVPFIAVNDRYAITLTSLDAQTLSDAEALMNTMIAQTQQPGAPREDRTDAGRSGKAEGR